MPPERTVKVSIEYNLKIMTSYETAEWTNKTFGEDNIVDFREIRDPRGLLKGFVLEIRIT